MKFTLLETSYPILYQEHDRAGARFWAVNSTIDAPSELYNRLDTHYIAKKLVWSEITNYEPFFLQFDLVHWNLLTTAELRIRFKEEENVLRNLHDVFHDQVKISVCQKTPAETIGGFEEELTFEAVRKAYTQSIPTSKLVQPGAPVTTKIFLDLPDDHQMIRKAHEISAYLRLNKRILEDGVAADVTIISKDGKEIKSHRSFLIASSVVFQRMFENEMEEAHTTGRIDMTDLSEAGVNAFLRHIYYGEKAGPEVILSMDVAFEQLYAAHKYQVQELEEFMTSYLVAISDEKFDVKLALKIFMFLRKTMIASDLKSKMVRVLQMKHDELMLLPEYKDLIEEANRDAMELCRIL